MDGINLNSSKDIKDVYMTSSVALLVGHALPAVENGAISVSPPPCHTVVLHQQYPLLHLVHPLQLRHSVLLLLFHPRQPHEVQINGTHPASTQTPVLAMLSRPKAKPLQPLSLHAQRRIRLQRLQMDPPRRQIRHHRPPKGVVWPNRLVNDNAQWRRR